MIQQVNQTQTQKHNFFNPNSAFKKYVKKEEEPIVKVEETNSHCSNDIIQDNTEASQNAKIGIQKKNKITKKKEHQLPYKSETKNIPKNFGVLLKKYLCTRDLSNPSVKAFLKNGDQKKNFSRQDFTKLFGDNEAAKVAREYFSGFKIINDLMISEKIQDVKNHLKYISKFYNSTFNCQELAELKLQ